jgi:hypothetical protein
MSIRSREITSPASTVAPVLHEVQALATTPISAPKTRESAGATSCRSCRAAPLRWRVGDDAPHARGARRKRSHARVPFDQIILRGGIAGDAYSREGSAPPLATGQGQRTGLDRPPRRRSASPQGGRCVVPGSRSWPASAHQGSGSSTRRSVAANAVCQFCLHHPQQAPPPDRVRPGRRGTEVGRHQLQRLGLHPSDALRQRGGTREGLAPVQPELLCRSGGHGKGCTKIANRMTEVFGTHVERGTDGRSVTLKTPSMVVLSPSGHPVLVAISACAGPRARP